RADRIGALLLAVPLVSVVTGTGSDDGSPACAGWLLRCHRDEDAAFRALFFASVAVVIHEHEHVVRVGAEAGCADLCGPVGVGGHDPSTISTEYTSPGFGTPTPRTPTSSKVSSPSSFSAATPSSGLSVTRIPSGHVSSAFTPRTPTVSD